MKETGSKPLQREDLDSDVSLVPMLQCLNTIFIHLEGTLGYKKHPKLLKTIVTSKQTENFT